MNEKDAPFHPGGRSRNGTEGQGGIHIDAVGSTEWLVMAISLSALLIGYVAAALIVN